MKKLFTLLALLVCAVGTVLADHWTPPTGYSNEDRLVVKAILSTNIGTPDDFEIGAFIGSSLRGSTAVLQTANNGDKFFLIEVYGSTEEIDQTVTFKAYYKTDGSTYSGSEYALPETTKFAHSTVPDPSTVGGAMTLTLNAATLFSINPFNLNVDDEVTLADKLTITPSNGVLPEGCKWALAIGGQGSLLVIEDANASISNGKLKGLSPCSNHTLFFVRPTSLQGYYESLAEGSFNVLQPATSISIVTSEMTVNKNDQTELTAFMTNTANKKAYQLNPTNSTDKVYWEFDSQYIEEVRNQNQEVVGWKPIQKGETTIKPYFINANNEKVYPSNPASIKLTIHVPATGMIVNWPNTTFKCNVGDDIYQRITNIVSFEPGDASITTFTLSDPGQTGRLNIDNNAKTAVAVQEGTVRVMINHIEAGERELDVEIFNPSKTIAATQNPMSFSESSSKESVALAIANNVTWGPAGTTPNGTFTTTDGWGSGGISPNGATFTIGTDKELTGSHAITATLSWNDYSNYDGTDATIATQTASCSFTVNFYKELMGFNITVTPNNNDPTQGTITLEPIPAEANFEVTNVNVTVVAPQYGNWTVAQVSGSGLSWTYSTALPGSYTVHAYESSNDIDDSKGFEVPALVDLVSGWQWKSNPYGNVAGDALQSFFGKDIIEARTQEDLFYNDISWGFWGSMTNTGIPQAKMYKARMNFPVTAQATNGSPMEGDEVITLQPGWNWVGSPYFYDRLIAGSAVDIEDTPNGIVIISKADGSAELGTTHQWSGNLKVLKKGEGYLFYNPTTAAATIKLKAEAFGSLPQGNEAPAGARGMYHSVWHYDHSQFANNMTMVAEMPELINESHYTIGAFVGDECRGEGSFEDGLAFITVHCNMGEQVSFRLHNELTDEYFDIDQTVTSRQRMGSLSEPFHMTSASNEATGITTLDNLTSSQSGDYYDLNGRNLSNSKWSNGQVRKGVQLQRQKNGTIRKVVR